MASVNPFNLLGDDDNDDPSQLLAAAEKQVEAKKAAAAAAVVAPAPAKFPSKPLPPAQAVREAKNNASQPRGGGAGGRGRGGRGGRSFPNREYTNENANGFSGGNGGGEDADMGRPVDRERGSYGGPRQSFRGGRRGGFANGEVNEELERPRRVFERRSGTGRGNEFKRDGAGRGNWGTTDDVIAQEAEVVVNKEDNLNPEKQEDEIPTTEANKDSKEEANAPEEKEEEEDKEMTLEEYEKIREEKRKALLAMKPEERKVDADKEFGSMKQLSLKKENDEIFIKLGSGKDSKKSKENGDRDEKVKKVVSINEFLKPAEGERSHGRSGRGRGRGRNDRGGPRGGFGGGRYGNSMADVDIKIADPGHFPTLGGK